jgi:hypothetical protein
MLHYRNKNLTGFLPDTARLVCKCAGVNPSRVAITWRIRLGAELPTRSVQLLRACTTVACSEKPPDSPQAGVIAFPRIPVDRIQSNQGYFGFGFSLLIVA